MDKIPYVIRVKDRYGNERLYYRRFGHHIRLTAAPGLRTAIPGKARIYYVTPGGRELEQELHRLFAADRVSGEWFIYSDAIREWIKADEARRIELRMSRDMSVRPQLKVVK